jgi:Fe-S cluster biogenesis protein NfuA
VSSVGPVAQISLQFVGEPREQDRPNGGWMGNMDATSDLTAAPSATIAGVGPDHERRVRDLNDLIDVVRPAVEADGGTVRLVSADTDSGVVTVELAGACGSCEVAGMTLEGGIARILRQRLDWVTEVSGSVKEDPLATGWGGWTPKL